MSDDAPKQLADHSAEVNAKVPQLVAAAKASPGTLNATLESLLALEKKTRLAADIGSSKVVALSILNLLNALQKWAVLNDHIRLLCNRRAQLKPVIQSVIQTGVTFVDGVPNNAIKTELINTLREVSEGKIFVELERARLTRTLAGMLEAEGKISQAADMLQDVQVEIMGSMEKKEKAEFLLEQIRMMLDKGDHVRADIIAKKVNKSVLGDEPEFEELKLKFYQLMVRYHKHANNYLSICQAYKSIYETPSIESSADAWKPVLLSLSVFAVLAPHSPEQVAIVKWLRGLAKLSALPSAHAVIELVSTPELIGRPIPQAKEWEKEFFSGENGKQMKADLDTRIVEHNIRLVARNYLRVTSSRLAALLQLTEEATEKHLSDMVSEKALFAKIDRPAGVVSFRPRRNPDIVLNEWSSDISDLLGLVEKTCHLINKENMMHGL
ncbi:PCI domain-containing protein [Plasmodiophora brassicae]|uniref:PCI domain-containing protein n=1 Tax=Plasmodiophora brassicae TaxID=37360 RepID=A0A0G4IT63_PLABS|nr:hypothetical protein PBRA_006569 [Plasmodiophora brassicae]SPQ94540.1 unnamed protein product [Plasmodiophora brassicae]